MNNPTQPELYLGYPIFLWEGVINFSSIIIAGLIIAFVTTFYLKRKDESTRVAGVILEKRVNAQHEILNVMENSSQKLEMPQSSAEMLKELMQDYNFILPYDPKIQYADIFSSVKKYRAFFKEFEELFSKHKLWLDFKVRHKMLLMQAYFSAINSSITAFNRIPLPVGIELKPKEMEQLSDKLLLILGAALDEEFNNLLMELEVLMVNSIYKLDLTRPKNSFLYKFKENKEIKKVEKFLLKESLMGQYLPSIAVLAMDLVASSKGIELTEEQSMEYLKRYSTGRVL